MISLKNDLNGLHNNTCIKVYDPEFKKVIGVYPNYKRAAAFLGITHSIVEKRCITKKRVHSPKYGKEVACRISSRKPEDEELIIKSRRKFL